MWIWSGTLGGDKYVDGGPVGAPLTLLAPPPLNMGGASIGGIPSVMLRQYDVKPFHSSQIHFKLFSSV